LSWPKAGDDTTSKNNSAQTVINFFLMLVERPEPNKAPAHVNVTDFGDQYRST